MQTDHSTVGEVARIFGAPAWQVRRVVDSLDAEIPRAAQYRLVPRGLLATIGAELHRRYPKRLEAGNAQQ